MIGLADLVVVVADNGGTGASIFYVRGHDCLDELYVLHRMCPTWSFQAYPYQEWKADQTWRYSA